VDRQQAGVRLAVALKAYGGRQDVVVLALPRGGVPVGFEVARALKSPLDVLVVRKLGLKGHEELAMGAVGPDGVRILNEEVVRWAAKGDLEEVTSKEVRELERRTRTYRQGRPGLAVAGKTLILVDDGLATGSSMKVAVAVVRVLDPAWVVVAVPVAPMTTATALREVADEVVVVLEVASLGAVGMWYGDFEQTTDQEARALLVAAAQPEA